MTSNLGQMNFNGYVSSPSKESSNDTIFPNGPRFDHYSNSTSPDSPHFNQIVFSTNMPYDVYPYSTTSPSYFPTLSVSQTNHDSTAKSIDRIPGQKRSEQSKDSEQESSPNVNMRRRAQNRASQRAFRDRKEKHLKGLEHQLEDLHEKHQDLLQSYTKQIDEMSRLKAKIAELSTEIDVIRHFQGSSYGELLFPERFDKFDAFFSTGTVNSQPDETTCDGGSANTDIGLSLDLFENSL